MVKQVKGVESQFIPLSHSRGSSAVRQGDKLRFNPFNLLNHLTISSTVSSAISRWVVSLPPATSHQPASGFLIWCEREVSDGVPWLPSAINGRNPAQVLMTSDGAKAACGKNRLAI